MTEAVMMAHRIRLNPTPAQAAYFWRCAGVARFTWNWALGEYNDALARGEKPNVIGLSKEFNRLRHEEGFAPFVGEVQSYAKDYAFWDLQAAINRYYALREEGKLKPPAGWKQRKDGKPFGWPRFKSRDKAKPVFGLDSRKVRCSEHSVRIIRCPDGPVNMTQKLRFDGKIMSGRVSYQAGHWYLSVAVEVAHETPEHDGPAVGVDLGIKHLAVTSDGTVYDNPKALDRYERKMRLLQRHLSRQTKGGANWKKTKEQIARLHQRIANIRRDALHKMTTELTETYSVVAIEDLNVAGMVKNHRLARAVSDAGMFEARRQLTYKARWKGGQVVLVDRWYPSSHLCNACGHKQSFELSVRFWICDACGSENHRDGNAALNIRDEGLRLL